MNQFKVVLIAFSIIALSIIQSHHAIGQEYFKKLLPYTNLHQAGAIKVFTDGGFIIAGIIQSTSDSLFLIKYSSCGNEDWSYTYNLGFKCDNQDFMIDLTPDDEPIFVTSTQSNNGSVIVVIKFSKNGSQVSQAKTYYSSNRDLQARELQVSPTGSIWIGVTHMNALGFMKLSKTGQVSLSYLYEYWRGSSYGWLVAPNNEALIYNDTHVLKIDSNGSPLWLADYPNSPWIRGISTNKKGYTICARSGKIEDTTRVYQINSEGNVTSNGFTSINFAGFDIVSNDFGESIITGIHHDHNPVSTNYPLLAAAKLSSTGKLDYSWDIDFDSQAFFRNIYTPSAYTGNTLYLLLDGYANRFQGTQKGVYKTLTNPNHLLCNDSLFLDTVSLSPIQHNLLPLILESPFTISDSTITPPTPSAFIPLYSNTCTFTSSQLGQINSQTDSITLCANDSLSLISAVNFDKYQWSTGDTTESINVFVSGLYWVKATSNCLDIYYDTIWVSISNPFSLSIEARPRHADLNEYIEFSLTNYSTEDSITWRFQDGFTTSKNNFSRAFESSGWKHFFVSVYTPYGCETIIRDSVLVHFQEVSIPNIFTPNGDGLNDEMFIKGEGITSFELRIFDRWGSVVVDLQNKNWNGLDKNGNPCSDGVYFYIFDYITDNGEKLTKKGNVTLMRGAP